MPKISRTEARWSEAGFVRPSGAIDRPIRSSELRVFPTSLNGAGIACENNDWSKATLKRPGKTMFAEFLRLGNATDGRVLEFTGRWGVLDARPALTRFVQKKFLGALPSMSDASRQ